jgi:hypothetical protein
MLGFSPLAVAPVGVNGGTTPPPTPSSANVDAPILLVRFAKMGIR